jgi:predicted HicB family RNase H-like nuclease
MLTMKQISVRVPVTLHAELLEEAKREGVSLNQLCLTKLARPLDWYRQKDARQDEKHRQE